MDELLAPILSHLDQSTPGDLIGFYLYGSATTTGLRPDSDIDTLILTHRSLTDCERSGLVSLLLKVSGWRGHAGRFPDAAARQPLEVTSLVLDGRLPQPVCDPEVVALLALARTLVTLATGQMVSTGAAAQAVAPKLTGMIVCCWSTRGLVTSDRSATTGAISRRRRRRWPTPWQSSQSRQHADRVSILRTRARTAPSIDP